MQAVNAGLIRADHGDDLRDRHEVQAAGRDDGYACPAGRRLALADLPLEGQTEVANLTDCEPR